MLVAAVKRKEVIGELRRDKANADLIGKMREEKRKRRVEERKERERELIREEHENRGPPTGEYYEGDL